MQYVYDEDGVYISDGRGVVVNTCGGYIPVDYVYSEDDTYVNYGNGIVVNTGQRAIAYVDKAIVGTAVAG